MAVLRAIKTADFEDMSAVLAGKTSLPFTPQPLSDVLGAEVVGFDVKSLSRPEDVLAIQEHLRDCQVLCFRDQSLEPQDLVRFISLFGKPQYHVLRQFALPGTPEIYVLSNVKEENGTPVGNAYEGLSWHSDLQGGNMRTAYTALYGVEVPPVRGGTRFASMYKAYEALPEERRRQIDGRNMFYSFGTHYKNRLKYLAERGITDHQYGAPLTEAQKKYAKLRAPLPMVDVNPYNGRKWLHLTTMGCAGVEGMSDEEAIALVDELAAFSTSAPFRYDHNWRARDLVMWDNRGLFHTAGDYDRKVHRRLIWRCLIADAE
jgi:taurine dioxygenase